MPKIKKKVKVIKKKIVVKKAKLKLKKKSLKQKAVKGFKPEGKLIGRVAHYFSDIKVAVIKLFLPLKEKENIRIIGGENTDFKQKAISMQIEHNKVKLAKKGSSVGLKVKEQVREGYKVYKI